MNAVPETDAGSSSKLLTPDRLWTITLAVVPALIVGTAIIVSVDRFNLAEQQYEFQLERTAAVKQEMGETLLYRSTGDTINPPGCITEGITIVHRGDNSYTGAVSYNYVAGPNSCQYARDGQCDEPNLCDAGTDTSDCGSLPVPRRFSCNIDITADGQAFQWEIRAADTSCLINQSQQARQFCYESGRR